MIHAHTQLKNSHKVKLRKQIPFLLLENLLLLLLYFKYSRWCALMMTAWDFINSFFSEIAISYCILSSSSQYNPLKQSFIYS